MNEHGGHAVGLDVSLRQLQHSRRIDAERGTTVPAVCATATALPFADDTFDIVFSSFGALQFVADAHAAVAEVARLLVPGGRFAFSVTHPTRWMFPDDPGEGGLVASQSYWDRTPYVEIDDASGAVSYVEHHRTIGDWVGLLAASGMALVRFDEPEWPEHHDRTWGGWSRTRGAAHPGDRDLRRRAALTRPAHGQHDGAAPAGAAPSSWSVQVSRCARASGSPRGRAAAGSSSERRESTRPIAPAISRSGPRMKPISGTVLVIRSSEETLDFASSTLVSTWSSVNDSCTSSTGVPLAARTSCCSWSMI